MTDVTPLGLSKVKPTKSELLTLAGWGATSDINPAPSTQLWLGVVKVSSVQPSTVYVVGYAPYADTSACLYDSGAPYFTRPSTGAPLLVSEKVPAQLPPHHPGNDRPGRPHRQLDQDRGHRPPLATRGDRQPGATVSRRCPFPFPAVFPCLWFPPPGVEIGVGVLLSVGGGAVAGVLAVRSVSRVVSTARI